MTTANVILMPSRAEAACRDMDARDRAMEAVARLVRTAGTISARIAMVRRIVRYGATCMVHMVGHAQAAAYLQALSGQVLADLDETDRGGR
jgi:hypothetical protein